MKRSLGIAVASTMLAGTAGLFLAPGTALADTCYPCDPQPVVSDTNGSAIHENGDTYAYEVGDLQPGSELKVFASEAPDSAPVRYAVLGHAVTHVATVRTAPAGAVLVDTSIADANGVARGTFTLPESLTGRVIITFEGVAGDSIDFSRAATLTVSPTGTRAATGGGSGGSTTTGSNGLPFTGSDSLLPLTIAGLGALVLGSGLVVVARRRRSTADVAA